MEELGFIQSLRRLNYHDDIILKTPTVSTGERLLAICFKNQTNINCSILEIEYPECEKHFQEIMRDLRWKAERNILALQNVKNLNGLFGLRCYSFNTVIPQDEIVQLWNAHASQWSDEYFFQKFRVSTSIFFEKFEWVRVYTRVFTSICRVFPGGGVCFSPNKFYNYTIKNSVLEHKCSSKSSEKFCICFQEATFRKPNACRVL